MKCAFVHVPNLYLIENKPVSNINFSAMGLFSLCHELTKKGHSAQIINLGLEKYLDKNFLLSDYIIENDFKIIALSMHWFYQIYDVLETARILKEKCPDVFITLGGYSASFYASEILEKFPQIDLIIKGEGEVPTVEVIDRLSNDIKDFSNIPNLVWKKNSEIIENKEKYFATDEQLSSFCFFSEKYYKNFDYYKKIPFELNYSKTNELNTVSTIQGITLGRGCLGNCAWCSGGFYTAEKITGRSCVSYRSIDSVISEIKTLKNDYNIELYRFAFDPSAKDKTYLMSLFKKIKEEFKDTLTVEFASHSLPSKDFIDLFKKSTSTNSTLTIAPEFENEKLRKKYKSFYYLNSELEDVLAYLEKLEIKSELYFSKVKEVEEKENEKTKNYIEKLKKQFKQIKNCYIFDIEVEPASFWTFFPEKFGLKDIKTFDDYYLDSKIVEKSFENINIFQ